MPASFCSGWCSMEESLSKLFDVSVTGLAVAHGVTDGALFSHRSVGRLPCEFHHQNSSNFSLTNGSAPSDHARHHP
jgi:hypothetical protein